MAIAKNPKRTTTPASERAAEAFIAGAGIQVVAPREQNKKPTMIRIDPDILERIDQAAKRLGISRSAFIVEGAVERLERME